MASLQDQLDQIHKGFESTQPDEVLEIMHRGTDDLIATGQHDLATGAGEILPEFELEDTDGNLVSSQEYLERGPLIINFFRGFW